MIRLGDGTAVSHQKIQEAVQDLWAFTGELVSPNAVDLAAAKEGIAPDFEQLRPRFEQKIKEVLTTATLSIPTNTWMQKGGKDGRHTEHLGFILAEMQHIQRAYPGNIW
jgi:ring-1,2-phenylacetyl-CoA epoxidase subunit PaaC